MTKMQRKTKDVWNEIMSHRSDEFPRHKQAAFQSLCYLQACILLIAKSLESQTATEVL